jgi:Protein of unknown function DUF262
VYRPRSCIAVGGDRYSVGYSVARARCAGSRWRWTGPVPMRTGELSSRPRSTWSGSADESTALSLYQVDLTLLVADRTGVLSEIGCKRSTDGVASSRGEVMSEPPQIIRSPFKDPKPTVERISQLAQRVLTGDILLPRFQRDFVWPRDKIIGLLDSIARNYPIGSILLW